MYQFSPEKRKTTVKQKKSPVKPLCTVVGILCTVAKATDEGDDQSK